MATSDTHACARDPVNEIPLSGYGDLLTVEDICNVLQVSDRTIYRLCEKDELPFVKLGRRLYFPKHLLVERLQLERTI